MTSTVYVSSIPYKTSANDLRVLFSAFGKVTDLQLHADWEHPTFEPFAHVTVEAKDVDALVTALDGKKLGAHFLRVHRKPGT